MEAGKKAVKYEDKVEEKSQVLARTLEGNKIQNKERTVCYKEYYKENVLNLEEIGRERQWLFKLIKMKIGI